VIHEDQLPINCKKINILTSDNIRLDALYFSNNDNSKNVIIYFHGNGGNIYYRIRECEQLSQMGLNVLLVSYRGYAKSEGSPSEKGVYIDGESAVNYATNELKFKLSNVVIFGRSLGTAIAIEVSQFKEISKLILITPLSSGGDVADVNGYGSLRLISGNPFNSIKKINNIRCPILVIHGDKDEVIPYNLGKKIFDTFKGTKILITVKNGDHNNLENVDPKLYWGSIESYLK